MGRGRQGRGEGRREGGEKGYKVREGTTCKYKPRFAFLMTVKANSEEA